MCLIKSVGEEDLGDFYEVSSMSSASFFLELSPHKEEKASDRRVDVMSRPNHQREYAASNLK
jgi:hypothetical protein